MSEVADTPAAPNLPEGWEFKKHGKVTPLGRNYPVRAWKLPEEPEEGITVDIVEMTPPPEGGRKGPATLHVRHQDQGGGLRRGRHHGHPHLPCPPRACRTR